MRTPPFDFMKEISEVRSLLKNTKDHQIPGGNHLNRRGWSCRPGRVGEADTTYESQWPPTTLREDIPDHQPDHEETERGDTNMTQQNVSRFHTIRRQFAVHTKTLLSPVMSSHYEVRGTVPKPDSDRDSNGSRNTDGNDDRNNPRPYHSHSERIHPN